ncbi:MAG: hypothetical protein K0R70_2274, partial [Steroidobacteraceae bacterium]|nr:hypothetical protein [Steroidobacteraceae bacterium]
KYRNATHGAAGVGDFLGREHSCRSGTLLIFT